MALPIPKTMRSLCIFAYCEPSKYEISSIPTPTITSPKHVLIKIYAASLNPTDTQGAAGAFKFAFKVPMPYKFGYDFSGAVAGVGDEVTKWKIGDEFFGVLPFQERGSASEYVVTSEQYLVSKPKGLSHIEAASLPLVSLTALQAFDKIPGGFEGKTVLIPGGLSGVGSIACQLAKNVYGAAKVITTVSTQKVKRVDELLGPGIVDQIIDYKTSDPLKVIPKGSTDILFDTAGVAQTCVPLVTKNGFVMTCTNSSGKDVKAIIPNLYFGIQTVLDLANGIYKWRIERHGPKFGSVLQSASGTDTERVKGWVEQGKLRPIVGRVVKLEDIKGIREVCTQLYTSMGGIGKVIVQIDEKAVSDS